MPVLLSVRLLGGKFACYLSGRKVAELAERRAATQWISDELRVERRRISRHSDVTGADVAAHRAGPAARTVTVDGAEWRFS